jgi:hypothetical protein
MSGFKSTGYGNPDNNLESPFISLEIGWPAHGPQPLFPRSGTIEKAYSLNTHTLIRLYTLLAKSLESTLLETSSCYEEGVGYIPEDIRLKVSASIILDVVKFWR